MTPKDQKSWTWNMTSNANVHQDLIPEDHKHTYGNQPVQLYEGSVHLEVWAAHFALSLIDHNPETLINFCT